MRVNPDADRVALRAYFLAENGTGSEPKDAISNWVEAEDRERRLLGPLDADLFRRLWDTSVDELGNLKGDLSGLYKKFGLKSTSVFRTDDVKKALRSWVAGTCLAA